MHGVLHKRVGSGSCHYTVTLQGVGHKIGGNSERAVIEHIPEVFVRKGEIVAPCSKELHRYM